MSTRRLVVLFFVLIVPAVRVSAQLIAWTQRDRPTGQPIYQTRLHAVVRSPAGVLVTVAQDGRIDRSTDGGRSWARCDSDMTSSEWSGRLWTAHAGRSGDIWVGNRQTLRSTDGGVTWSIIDGLPTARETSSIVETPDGTVFAARFGVGVFRSTDRGATWTEANSGLTQANVHSLASDSSGVLYAGTDVHVFRSTDRGTTWTSMTESLAPVFGFWYVEVGPQGALFVGTAGKGGTYRSTDRGETWTLVGTTGYHVRGISSGGVIYAQSGDPLQQRYPAYRSTDGGATWSELSSRGMAAIAFGPDREAFVALNDRGLERTTDDGVTWQPVRTAPLLDTVTAIGVDDGGRVYSGTPRGIRVSLDNASSWSGYGTGLPALPVSAIGAGPARSALATVGGRLYRSTDVGATWQRVEVPTSGAITALTSAFGTVLVGTSEGRLLRSADAEGWEELPLRATDTINAVVRSLAGHFLASSRSALHFSFDGVEWSVVDGVGSATIRALAVDSVGVLYVGGDAGLYASDDGGVVWKEMSSEGWAPVLAMVADNQRGVIALTPPGLQVHARDHTRWFPLTEETRDWKLLTLAGGPRYRIYAGSEGLGFWLGTYSLGWLGVATDRVRATAAARCVPMPLAGRGQIELDIREAGRYALRLLDAAGRTVRYIGGGALPVGTARFDIDVDGLAAGAYYVETLGPSGRSVTPVVVAG